MTREPRISVRLYAWDGSIWDLLHGPVRATTAGIRGLAMPEIQWNEDENALLDGVTTDSFKVKARRIMLPLRFATEDVVGTQRNWWRAWRPGKRNRLEVTDGWGGLRSLVLKYVEDGGIVYRLDPHVDSGDSFGIVAQADDPWWRGDPELTTFDPVPQPGPFLGPTTGRAVVYISPGITDGGARTVGNPGDEATWPIWRVYGEGDGATSFHLGVDGQVIDGDVDVAADRVLEINTDPTVQTAMLLRLDGSFVANRTPQLDRVEFAPILAGEESRVTATIAGSGRIEMELPTTYYRAF